MNLTEYAHYAMFSHVPLDHMPFPARVFVNALRNYTCR